MTLTKKIPDTNGLVQKTDYNAKIMETEGKIPSITGLATAAALNTVEHRVPNVSNLVKKEKTDSDSKISDTESKNFTTSDYNKFTNEIIDNIY